MAREPGAPQLAPGSVSARRVAVAVVCGVVAAAGAVLGAGATVEYPAIVVFALAIALAPQGPRGAAALTLAGGGAMLAAGADYSDLTPLLVGGAAYCLGRHLRGVEAVAAVLALLTLLEWRSTGDDAVPWLLTVLAAELSGMALRSRALLAEQLAQRGADLAAERELFAELSVRYERARIASELHDIVAHAISVMVIQAGAGQRLVARDPEATVATFAAIRGAARQAEADITRLVALLAEPEQTAEVPDLALVSELVERAAGSGLDVTLRLEGACDGLSVEVARCAFLVVRESLTNALRYGSGAPVTVCVAGGRERVEVTVVNGPPTTPAAGDGLGGGHGLAGLRERLDTIGGRLQAGQDGAGGWRVRAQMPRRARVPVGG